MISIGKLQLKSTPHRSNFFLSRSRFPAANLHHGAHSMWAGHIARSPHRRHTMKVSQAIDFYLQYHQANS